MSLPDAVGMTKKDENLKEKEIVDMPQFLNRRTD